MFTVRNYYDQEAEKYQKKRQKLLDWLVSREMLKRYFEKHLPPKGSLVLDAGGGLGFWSLYFAKKNYKVVLVDFSSKMLKIAKMNAECSNNISFIKSDLTNLSHFGNNSFNFTMCLGQTLSQIVSYKNVIKELVRVTKPSGKIVVEVDGKYGKALSLASIGEIELALKILETGSGYDPFKTHAFTPSELRQEFEKAGAKLVTMFGVSTICDFLPDMLAQRLLRRKAMLERLMKEEFKHKEKLVQVASRIVIVSQKPRCH